MSDKQQEKTEQINLNPEAKEYKPSKKKKDPENGEIDDKLNFNLNAKQYIPKSKTEFVEADDDEDDNINQEVIDKMMQDDIENEVMEELGNISEDEDKWLPKYKDCPCCKGYVFNCSGQVCKDLGQCYCKMTDDCEEEKDEDKDKSDKN